MQVTDFVPVEAIDDRYFDQPYYLLPDKGGEHAYAVLRKRSLRHRRIGIGKVVMRDGSISSRSKASKSSLVLTMMRYADEMVDAPEMPDVDRIKVPASELKLATDFIGALAAEWKPGSVHRRLSGEPARK